MHDGESDELRQIRKTISSLQHELYRADDWLDLASRRGVGSAAWTAVNVARAMERIQGVMDELAEVQQSLRDASRHEVKKAEKQMSQRWVAERCLQLHALVNGP